MLPSPGAQPPVSVAPREHDSDDTVSTPRDDSPAAASSLDPAPSDNHSAPDLHDTTKTSGVHRISFWGYKLN